MADGSLIARAADHLLGLNFETWAFGDSVGFEAMLAATAATGDPRYASFAHGFFRAWAARAQPYRPLDCTAPGLAMVEVAGQTGDGRLTEALTRLAEYLASRRQIRGLFATWEASPLRHPYGPGQLPPEDAALLRDPGAGVFVDCLHFDPPFFTSLGRLTGEATWTAIGIEQALGYIRLLQGAESGLFHHFWLEKTERCYIPGWGRGQGWALLGLLDVLEQIGDDENRDEIVAAAQLLGAAMLRTQRADGHWSAVVQDPESGDESSTAAFMAAAFRRGTALGVFDDRFAEPAQRALDAAVRMVDAGGVLTGVSAAVWACTLPSHYNHVPRGFLVPWGQGPLVLALAEIAQSHSRDD